MNQAKEDYLEHWTNQTNNQSRINTYLNLKRESKWAMSPVCQEYEAEQGYEVKARWPCLGEPCRGNRQTQENLAAKRTKSMENMSLPGRDG